MEIKSILDVSPEMASDIRYLWDETSMTSVEIAQDVIRGFIGSVSISLDVVQDILGGAYVYEDHQD
jgi:hypothetical protein